MMVWAVLRITCSITGYLLQKYWWLRSAKSSPHLVDARRGERTGQTNADAGTKFNTHSRDSLHEERIQTGT